MKSLTVEAGDERYDVLVGRLEDCRSRLVALAGGKPLVVVTEPKVWEPSRRPAGSDPAVRSNPHARRRGGQGLASPPGAGRGVHGRNLDRSAAVAAFGGGSIGDLAGLAAGLFKRGLPIIQLPTTLLAQADSAVGGKTAIDAMGQKNLVGMFHQPRLVVADVSLLDTPRRSPAPRRLCRGREIWPDPPRGPVRMARRPWRPTPRRPARISRGSGVAERRRQGSLGRSRRHRPQRHAGTPQLRPHLRPCDRKRGRARHPAPRRSGGDRDGAGVRPVGGAGPVRP